MDISVCLQTGNHVRIQQEGLLLKAGMLKYQNTGKVQGRRHLRPCKEFTQERSKKEDE